MGSMITLV